jgi:hypothetical protein
MRGMHEKNHYTMCEKFTILAKFKETAQIFECVIVRTKLKIIPKFVHRDSN